MEKCDVVSRGEERRFTRTGRDDSQANQRRSAIRLHVPPNISSPEAPLVKYEADKKSGLRYF